MVGVHMKARCFGAHGGVTRLFIVLALVVLAAPSSLAAHGKSVRYSMFKGSLDLVADGYCVRGDAHRGLFSVRTLTGAAEWAELHVRARVNGCDLPQFASVGFETGVSEVDRYELVYTNSAARAQLVFKPGKVVLSLAIHRSRPMAIDKVSVGVDQRTDSDYLFDPTIDHLPYHEFPIEVGRRIEPGLASPPPWMFSYRKEGRPGCWSVALEPEPDNIEFSDFRHVPQGRGRVGWEIEYWNVPERSGDLLVPPIALRFGDEDFFSALRRHVGDLRAEGKIRVPDRHLPDWHCETIACTWRFQQEKPRNEQATEENCEAFVKMLEDNGVSFGTLIIDDFWGKKHGVWEADPKKWKDIRGFIDRQHAKGRHVLLWICTDGDGLPGNERIEGQWDLDSAAFQCRLEESARRMLSSADGCYNADGVKFDFTSSYPSGGERQRDFGCGYILRRFEMLTAALLAVKPGAILDYQCYNPYFTHTLTMLRLNDYFGAPEHGFTEMQTRAKMASICAPGALIDTDHVSYRNFPYRGAYEFFRRQHELGVPSIYLMPDDLSDVELMSILRTRKTRKINLKGKTK